MIPLRSIRQDSQRAAFVANANCWLESLCPRPLVTAAALLLNGRAGYRSVRTKHAAIAGLRLKQRFAVAAFIKILTRIRGHDLLLCMAAAWAGQDGLPDDGAHGFVMSFEGKPASV